MATIPEQRRFGRGQDPARRDVGRGLTSVLNFVVRSHVGALAFLIVWCGLAFLPGFFNIPPIDREEVRFAQATKQMIEGGDYLDIRFQNEVRYKKPVGIYWLQAAAVETAAKLGLPRADVRIWLYRVPSLFGAFSAVLLTYWAALAFVTRRGAVLAALIMASSVLLGAEARLAKADAVFLMACVAAMGALARVYLSWQRAEDLLRPPWRWPIIFWTALAAGMLVKGPLVLMFAGLPILALVIADGSAGWVARLRPGIGVLWLLLLSTPWLVPNLFRTGNGFLSDYGFVDLWGKLIGEPSHRFPPGVYLLLFWITFWPGAPLAALAAPAAWRARREPGAQFLLAWLVPSWIVLELVVTKFPHYVLPLYPAVAILTAGVLERRMLSHAWMVKTTALWFFIPAIGSVTAVVAAIALTHQPAFLAWPFVAAALILGLFAWWLYDDYRAERSLLNAVSASLCMAIVVYGVVMPHVPAAFPSSQIARALRNVVCVKPAAAAAGFYEPSLIFMTGTSTVLTDGSGAADFLSQGTCRFALVESRSERAFAQRADQIGLRYNVATKIEGYDLPVGRAITISIFRSEGTR